MGCLLIRSLVWGNVGEMVQLHGKSAGMVSPRGKALDPAHSDSQRLSLALFPALGTSQAADGSGSEFHQLFVARQLMFAISGVFVWLTYFHRCQNDAQLVRPSAARGSFVSLPAVADIGPWLQLQVLLILH